MPQALLLKGLTIGTDRIGTGSPDRAAVDTAQRRYLLARLVLAAIRNWNRLHASTPSPALNTSWPAASVKPDAELLPGFAGKRIFNRILPDTPIFHIGIVPTIFATRLDLDQHVQEPGLKRENRSPPAPDPRFMRSAFDRLAHLAHLGT
jgi:hypothetical protein